MNREIVKRLAGLELDSEQSFGGIRPAQMVDAAANVFDGSFGDDGR
jgi:hypothetical protein